MPSSAVAAGSRRRSPSPSADRAALWAVLRAVRHGDFSARYEPGADGDEREIARELNAIIEMNQRMTKELSRVAEAVGKEGRTSSRAALEGASGGWRSCQNSVNDLIVDLVQPTTEVARVISAVAEGDLSQKISLKFKGRAVKGVFLQTAQTINSMVDQLNTFASEVTRVAREVGTEGNLGGQAAIKGVSGVWKDLTANVNTMAANLTSQVRNIAEVTTAVANGDLSRKITIPARGEILRLKNTINTMVDQLSTFAGEVTRVAREVGTDGKLGGQATIKGVSGVWKDLTENVNTMAANLTSQVRNIAEVTTAVANGDLSKKITVDVKGEILRLKNTINAMVDQLNTFTGEVTRVAREVGTDGKLGGQAAIKGVSGVWKDLTENVNTMAANLTSQVRNIAEVTTAVANGDLSRKITVDVKGEIFELKKTINSMVDQLSTFAGEVTRVAREVGTDGNLGGQARVPGVAGIWRDLTDNVNQLAANLTTQVRNIAEVTTAVARGDLSKKITVDVRGEILELKNTINTMVDQLSTFAGEVTRVAREVGTEGKLGGQAAIKGVSGVWKDLTENVNTMAANLTSQVRNIAEVTTAVARGDLSKKITVDVRGEILELKNTINTMVDQLSIFAEEVTRVAREVGTEGKLGGQAVIKGVSGVWKDLTENVNTMAANLTDQVRDIAEVTTAVANGDLSKKITVDVKGEILRLKNTINAMVDQLSTFAGEVTRVAREVGTDGKLGGQAAIKGVSGVWKDLTENVNTMAANLTSQVRGIVKVVTAVANGDLKRKLVLEARGEIAALAETINGMIDTLATFADQVTTVAREVGTEGKLGGQARVPGAAGIWRDLTDNVNQLAANLTTQVRAIGEVATAVTKGDLTRSITVEAQGEVLALRDNINEMIGNLRGTTQKNVEQDWLKTNLAKFAAMLQGQRDLQAVAQRILSDLASVVDAQHGVFYIASPPTLKLLASYAYRERKHLAPEIRFGEGLVGQCAVEKQRILLAKVPPDYVQISSALGEAAPINIVVLPVLFEGQVQAVIEISSFRRFGEIQITFLDQLTDSLGIVLNTIAATMRTEGLLQQSQSLTEQLRAQQDELRNTNEELEEKAQLLTVQKREVEAKNREVEIARQSIEEKAEQLALTSKYKSQFLANMSHELRTPLNSLLILARQLSENAEGNLSVKQVEYARSIHGAGADLLSLINEILDLAKIESGKMIIEPGPVPIEEVREYLERSFRHVASDKNLEFLIEAESGLPQNLVTDGRRLQQILRNLLSNAFKFTARGGVTVRIEARRGGWRPGLPSLDRAEQVIAFSVCDTGIGIPKSKQSVIFEAFQQADGGTSRRYGGTGLGLTISREIVTLLGGEIVVESEPGAGSTFTLFLPAEYATPVPGRRPARHVPAEEVISAAEVSVATAQRFDDRDTISPGDRVLLVVEDDAPFAKTVLETAHERGFKGLVASTGGEAIELARRYRPDAVTLDLRLPDMEGWTVLDRLKHDPTTRHIPVEIVSAVEEDLDRGLRLGAIAHIAKPVTREGLLDAVGGIEKFLARRQKNLLVVEDDDRERQAILEIIGNGDVVSTAVGTAAEALASLREGSFDCMVLDLGLPDRAGFDLIEEIRRDPALRRLPIVVYTGRDLSPDEEFRLRLLAGAVVVKDARSPERLLDETAFYLHRVPDRLPEAKRKMIEAARRNEYPLAGKRMLVVDDDMRNIFALTSLLERHRIEVLHAENGREAIRILRETPGIEGVLMDVMMPEMDGYEATAQIRKIPQFEKLPIIALTAKAMQGDRARCLEAGASDYIAKPVDSDQLLSILRVWMG